MSHVVTLHKRNGTTLDVPFQDAANAMRMIKGLIEFGERQREGLYSFSENDGDFVSITVIRVEQVDIITFESRPLEIAADG